MLLEGQGRTLCFPQNLVEAPLLQVFAALHKMLETARKALQDVVNATSLLQQLARQPQKKAALHRIKPRGEVACQHVIECLIQRCALFKIGEKAPESCKCSPRLALCDHI